MPEYLAPGVYVEEVDTGSKPIEGVSTSTAGMVGVTAWGPEKIATLVTGFADFQRQFGSYLDPQNYSNAWYLPHAVEGFFTNGGKRLYIVRVLPAAAAAAATFLVDKKLPSTVKTTLGDKAVAGTSELTLVDATGVTKDMVFKLDDGQFAEYVKAKNDANTATNKVELEFPLARDHLKGARLEERNVLLKVQVIDKGNWGNTLQVTPDDDESLLETSVAADALQGQRKVTLNTTQGIEPGSILDFFIQKSVSASKVIIKDALENILRFAPALDSKVDKGTKVRLKGTTEVISVTEDAKAGDQRLFLESVDGFKQGDKLEILKADGSVDGTGTVTVSSIQNALGDFVRFTPALDSKVDKGTKVRLKGTTEGTFVTEDAKAGEQRLFLESADKFKQGDKLEILNSPIIEVTVDTSRKIPSGTHVRLKGTNWETLLKRVQDHGLVLESIDKIEVKSEKDQIQKLEILLGNFIEEVEVESIEVKLTTEVGEDLSATATDKDVAAYIRGSRVDTELMENVAKSSSTVKLKHGAGVEPGAVLILRLLQQKVASVDKKVVTLDTDLGKAVKAGWLVRTREFKLRVDCVQTNPLTRQNRVVMSETHRHLSLDPRHSRYVETVIGVIPDGTTPLRPDGRTEGEGKLIRVKDEGTDKQSLRLGPELVLGSPPIPLGLTGGDDQIETLSDLDYIGQDNINPQQRTGLQALKNIDEVSVVAIPGRTNQRVQEAVITHCELMRYRFAVIDSREEDEMAAVQVQRSTYDTKYAALYYPWLAIPDPFPPNPQAQGNISIPPSGHIMGIYVRSDIERGVHKAPANEVIRGIADLEVKLMKEQQDILNPRNINVLRNFREDNRGLRVWGARTLSSDPDWKYVNVRRLFIFIEKSIDRGTQWVVFEPNNEALWQRVKRVVTAFLTQVWRDGALMGQTKEQAFFVRCDRTTMTQEDIDNGRLIIQVGIAPVKPAEFVIFRIGQWTGGASLEEG